MIYLNIFIQENSNELKISLEERAVGNETTLQQYLRTSISFENIQSLSKEINFLIYSSAHSSEKKTKKLGQSLKESGQHLYDLLLPSQIKDTLSRVRSKDLFLVLDDSLISIPWEVLYDGKDFFCLQFNMGRKVHTSHQVYISNTLKNEEKIKMLIIADPRNDLPMAYDEGYNLAKIMEQWDDDLEVCLETSDIDLKKIFRKIFEFDILHYAGHANYNPNVSNSCGWHLKDNYLTPQHIMKMYGGNKTFPSLVFSNACQSGQTTKWGNASNGDKSYDLVNAFLRCGVRHYIGTFQDIADKISLNFATAFYGFMMQSRTIGESLNQARNEIIKQHGIDNLTWANYMLYGDPTICYLKSIEGKKGIQADSDKTAKAQDFIKGRESIISSFENKEWENEQNGILRTSDSSEPMGHIKGQREKNKIFADAKFFIKKGWEKTILLSIVIISILLFVIVGLRSISLIKGRPPMINDYNHSWEKEKWQIVREIQEKLHKKYSQAPVLPGYFQSQVENESFSICIIPALPEGKMQKSDQYMTHLFIEELNLLLSEQTEIALVERERLDFVLAELERISLNVDEEKLRFVLGQILGANGILFIQIFTESDISFFNFFNKRNKKVFIRLVNTKTSLIEFYTKTSFAEDESLEQVSRDMGKKIIVALRKKYKL